MNIVSALLAWVRHSPMVQLVGALAALAFITLQLVLDVRYRTCAYGCPPELWIVLSIYGSVGVMLIAVIVAIVWRLAIRRAIEKDEEEDPS